MMLADHGAEVIRIEREGRAPVIPPEFDILARGRAETLRSIFRPRTARRGFASWPPGRTR
jgi:crotonobetainyl-CoA:carnitine CoA-transferase CaiB-like acyl-CoA transferase